MNKLLGFLIVGAALYMYLQQKSAQAAYIEEQKKLIGTLDAGAGSRPGRGTHQERQKY